MNLKKMFLLGISIGFISFQCNARGTKEKMTYVWSEGSAPKKPRRPRLEVPRRKTQAVPKTGGQQETWTYLPPLEKGDEAEEEMTEVEEEEDEEGKPLLPMDDADEEGYEE